MKTEKSTGGKFGAAKTKPQDRPLGDEDSDRFLGQHWQSKLNFFALHHLVDASRRATGSAVAT